MRFMGCSHATALDLGYLQGEGSAPRQDRDDAVLLQKQGDAHEAAHLARLKACGIAVAELARADLAANAQATRAALAQGPPYAFQRAVLWENRGGRPDFLEAVEAPS